MIISLFYCFLGGILYALGFPTPWGHSLFFTPILGFSILFFFLSHWSFKKSFWALTFFCWGFNLLGYYWIPYTLKSFGNFSAPGNYILWWLGFVFIIAPQLWVFGLLACWWKRLSLNSTTLHLLLSLILCALEVYIPQQFPGHMGHPFLTLAPYLGLAPVFGVPVFSFVGYFLSMELVYGWKHKRFPLFASVFLIIFIIPNILWPLSKKKTDEFYPIRIVQANVGNYLKLQSEKGQTWAIQEILQTYQSLSLSPANPKPKLIIWPETAYPYNLSSNRPLEPQLSPEVLQTLKISEANLLFGAYDSIQESSASFESSYNASFLIDPVIKNPQIYHKHLLIPFGETLPFGPLNQKIAPLIPEIAYFAKGKEWTLFETTDHIRFINPICYEVLFSNFLREYLNAHDKNPHFILNLTNDSWYGKTSEPHQHLFLAQWRALEFGLPLVRSTNTGITTVLYPDGSQDLELSVGEKNFLDVNLSLVAPKPTYYQRFGFLGTLGLAFFLMILSLLPPFKQKSSLLQ